MKFKIQWTGKTSDLTQMKRELVNQKIKTEEISQNKAYRDTEMEITKKKL